MQPWWIIAAVLLCLGLNKQLDLQTMLITLGRSAAQSVGWMPYRRVVQAVFLVLFTLALLAWATYGVKKWGPFLKEQPLVLRGGLLLLLFVLIRASSINHVDEFLHLNLHGDYWGWLLELSGTTCLGWAAARIKAH